MTVSINIDVVEATKADYLLAAELLSTLEAHSVSISGGHLSTSHPASNVQVGYPAAQPVTQDALRQQFQPNAVAAEAAQFAQPAAEPAKKTRRSSAEVAAEKAAKAAAKAAGVPPQFAQPVPPAQVPAYDPNLAAQFAQPSPQQFAQQPPAVAPAPQQRVITLDDCRNVAGDLAKLDAQNGQAVFVNCLAKYGMQQLSQVTDPGMIAALYNDLTGMYMQMKQQAAVNPLG